MAKNNLAWFAWSKGDFWWKATIVIMGLYVVFLLYNTVQDLSGKKCLKWSKRYNIWTKQWDDRFPCLDWSE